MNSQINDTKPWLKLYPNNLPTEIKPDFDNMLDAFNAVLNSNANANAIYYFDGIITYDQLDKQSNALALVLEEKGFNTGDRLAIYAQNNPSFVVGMLAAWKLGGIVVPINPMNLEREFSYILKDCDAKAILCLDNLYQSVVKNVINKETNNVKVIITFSSLDHQTQGDNRVLDSIRKEPQEGALDLKQILSENISATLKTQVNLKNNDIALLAYTSGTTGNPKGAMITHGNISFNAQTYRDWIKLTPDDCILGMAPVFHITGAVAHLAAGLLTGCPVVLMHRFHPSIMIDSLRKFKPTFTVGAITAFINLMNNPEVKKEDFASFRVILSGGAPISPATSKQFEDFSGQYIYNVFGMTETCSPTHIVPIGTRAPVDQHSGMLSVGIPVFNTNVRLIRDDGMEAGIGEFGEIIDKGPQVMLGYWNMPEATASVMSQGWLRTGDVAVMDANGWFYLVDRKKDMINAGGYKVWPREVEDVLYSHPSVREAAVIGIPDDYRGETVKAVVSLKNDSKATVEELIEHCKSNMATYKYPRIIEIVDELPKTATGKILRRDLK